MNKGTYKDLNYEVISVITFGPYTLAEVRGADEKGKEAFKGFGVARRNPTDRPDETKGRKIAIGKAAKSAYLKKCNKGSQDVLCA